MDLPDDVVQIIKEYSMPMTRPDWRTLRRIPLQLYKHEYLDILKKRHSISYEKFLTSNRVFTLNRYYDLFGWTMSLVYIKKS